MTPRAYWDRYDHARIDMPSVPELSDDEHSQRLYRTCRMDEYHITEEHVCNARHAYY
jgi:choline-sulfatase